MKKALWRTDLAGVDGPLANEHAPGREAADHGAKACAHTGDGAGVGAYVLENSQGLEIGVQP